MIPFLLLSEIRDNVSYGFCPLLSDRIGKVSKTLVTRARKGMETDRQALHTLLCLPKGTYSITTL